MPVARSPRPADQRKHRYTPLVQAPRRDRTGEPVRERGGAVVVLRRLDLIDVNAVAETLGENERCFQLRCDVRLH